MAFSSSATCRFGFWTRLIKFLPAPRLGIVAALVVLGLCGRSGGVASAVLLALGYATYVFLFDKPDFAAECDRDKCFMMTYSFLSADNFCHARVA